MSRFVSNSRLGNNCNDYHYYVAANFLIPIAKWEKEGDGANMRERERKMWLFLSYVFTCNVKVSPILAITHLLSCKMFYRIDWSVKIFLLLKLTVVIVLRPHYSVCVLHTLSYIKLSCIVAYNERRQFCNRGIISISMLRGWTKKDVSRCLSLSR